MSDSSRSLTKCFFFCCFPLFLLLTNCKSQTSSNEQTLFNGINFAGWEGDTIHTWRIEKGAIIGGSLEHEVPHNDFLCTKKSYSNFILKLKIKLTGSEGFINSGIQFHSKRMLDPEYEMIGYQADWGEGYWASLYDESRRRKTLMAPDSVQIQNWIKKNDWNDYEVHTEDNHIKLFINGHQTIDYIEDDLSIPKSGIIGIQIHGDGKAEAAFKDITIEEIK